MASNYPETPLDAALAYARKGWFVLPLAPGRKEPYGKLAPRGWHDATDDEPTIRSWFENRPDLGVGISLEQSGLVAIDIDTHDGMDGHATIERLEHEHGSLDSTAIQLTPSGGEHRLFANPEHIRLPGKLLPEKGNVDLKSNGYICAYPSQRSDCSGNKYEWDASSDPIAEDAEALPKLPDWIAQMGQAPKATSPNDATEKLRLETVSDFQWAELKSALKYIPSDSREVWLQVGFALQATGRPDARELWDEWSRTCPGKYSDEAQEKAWRSFRSRGWEGIGYRSVFKFANDQGWTGLTQEEAKPFQGADESSGAPVQVRTKKRNRIQSYTEVLAASIGQRWLVKGYLPMTCIGVMYGKSGTGKSWIAVDIALHVAVGLNWWGHRVRKSKVVYIAAEGGFGVSQRVEAFRKAHPGMTPEQINENFFLIAGAVNFSEPNCMKTPLPNADDVDSMMKEKGIEPGLIVIDTLSQTLSGADENDASAIALYMNQLAEAFRDRYRCCVLVVHHSGKGDQNTPRGSSAIQANTSFLYTVTRQGTDLRCQLSCMHMKDSATPDPLSFEWMPIEIGKDEDGDPIKSIYLVKTGSIDPTTGIETKAPCKTVPWNDKKRVGDKNVAALVDAVNELCSSQAYAPKAETQKLFAEKLGLAGSTARVYFMRAKDKAVLNGYLEYSEEDGFSTPASPGGDSDDCPF